MHQNASSSDYKFQEYFVSACDRIRLDIQRRKFLRKFNLNESQISSNYSLHSNCCVLPFLRKHWNLENQTGAQHYINVLKYCYRKSIIGWKRQCSWVWHLRTCSDTTFSKRHFRRKPGNILHINTLSMLPY